MDFPSVNLNSESLVGINNDHDNDDDDDNDDGDGNDDDGDDCGSDWQTCSDTATENKEEDEDNSNGDPVYKLNCTHCSSLISSRAMKVYLVADSSQILFSTDIPTENIHAGESFPITSCDCKAEEVICNSCSKVVGYHVLEPCCFCSSEDHNSHYWLFNANAVTADRRDISWSQLSYNGCDEIVCNLDEPVKSSVELIQSGNSGNESNMSFTDDQYNDLITCCICAASPMYKPTRITSCRHMFCFGCISREVDARKKCPLDRLAVSREMLETIV